MKFKAFLKERKWEDAGHFQYMANPSPQVVLAQVKRHGHGRWVEDADTKEFIYVNGKDATHWDVIRDVLGANIDNKEEELDRNAAGHMFYEDGESIFMDWGFQDNKSKQKYKYERVFDKVLTPDEFEKDYPRLFRKM